MNRLLLWVALVVLAGLVGGVGGYATQNWFLASATLAVLVIQHVVRPSGGVKPLDWVDLVVWLLAVVVAYWLGPTVAAALPSALNHALAPALGTVVLGLVVEFLRLPRLRGWLNNASAAA